MTLTLRELSDREEIRETIIRWSRAVDTADWELFRASFTEDLAADFSELGLPVMPAAELGAVLERSMDHFEVMHHILSNTTYHEVNEQTARTSTLVTATSVPKGGAPFQTLAWYHDDLRRTADGWRICKRKCQHVFDSNPVRDFKPPGLSR
jgi:ketosteroid isomerase-like protein